MGEPRRGKQEMKHILPWRWEVVPLSEKLFTFEGQTLSSYSGVKLASEVSLACLCLFPGKLYIKYIKWEIVYDLCHFVSLQLPLATCRLTRSELRLLLCHREW